MELIFNDNAKREGENCVVALSGFGANTDSQTIKNIFDYGDENSFDIATFKKAGHMSDQLDFSIASLTSQILEAQEKLGENYSNFYCVANSITSPAFLKAYSNLSQESKNRVKKIVFLSPVFDLGVCIRNYIHSIDSKASINKERIEYLGSIFGVSIDIPKILEELEQHTYHSSGKVLGALGQKSDIYFNNKDTLIGPENIPKMIHPDNNLYTTSDVAGDTTHHNIDFIAEKIGNRSLK